MSRIVVVGAGIVGLSVARAARLRGHEVVVLEQGPIPNPQAASSDDHRMIRYHYGSAIGYARMVGDAFKAWDQVWDDLGAKHFADVGGISIAEKPGDYAHRTLATFREMDLPHEVLDREAVERLCPHFTLPEGSFGVVAHPGGALFARRIVEGLAAFVTARGAELRPNTRVVEVEPEAGRVTLASGETITGDVVVVSAGAWLPALMPERFGDLSPMRQALCYVKPPEAYRESWSKAPALVSMGDRGTYSLPGVMGTDLKFGFGGHRRPGAPGSSGFASEPSEAGAVIGAFADFLRDAQAYEPLRLWVGYYVMDQTRRFRLEQHGRGLFVTNCDGQMFKFGPLLGERIVATLEGERSMSDLARWAAGY